MKLSKFTFFSLVAIFGVLTSLAGAFTYSLIYQPEEIIIDKTVREVSVNGETKLFSPKEIYNQNHKGVVYIQTNGVNDKTSPFGPQNGVATGSGFVIDKEGHIITNSHVIEGSKQVTVKFSDKKRVSATVIGSDISSDIALLKIDDLNDLDLTVLKLGDAKKLEVGDPVVAIGNPFGLEQTLTEGIVSALQREISAPNGFVINNVIQTDAAINPGNSGGPLLNINGEVVGVNSQIATSSEGSNGNVGIAFAVPSNTINNILSELKSGKEVKRAWLGISGIGTKDIPGNKQVGVLVQKVSKDSPAAKAGVITGNKTQDVNGQKVIINGSLITKIDNKEITEMEDIINVIADKKPDDDITITFKNGNKELTEKVELTQRPADQ